MEEGRRATEGLGGAIQVRAVRPGEARRTAETDQAGAGNLQEASEDRGVTHARPVGAVPEAGVERKVALLLCLLLSLLMCFNVQHIKNMGIL